MRVMRLLRFFRRSHGNFLAAGFVFGLATGLVSFLIVQLRKTLLNARQTRHLRLLRRKRIIADTDVDVNANEFGPVELRCLSKVVHGIPGLIGNTPLMRINSLSDMTGCEILAVSYTHLTLPTKA